MHVVFAREGVFQQYPTETPDVTEAEPGPEFPVPTLDALIRMKLTSFRLKDKVRLLDLIGVGLVDETWLNRVPEHSGRDSKNCWSRPIDRAHTEAVADAAGVGEQVDSKPAFEPGWPVPRGTKSLAVLVPSSGHPAGGRDWG